MTPKTQAVGSSSSRRPMRPGNPIPGGPLVGGGLADVGALSPAEPCCCAVPPSSLSAGRCALNSPTDPTAFPFSPTFPSSSALILIAPYLTGTVPAKSVSRRTPEVKPAQSVHTITGRRSICDRTIVRDGEVRRCRFFRRMFSYVELRDWLMQSGFRSVDGFCRRRLTDFCRRHAHDPRRHKGERYTIVRRGRVVAKLEPAHAATGVEAKRFCVVIGSKRAGLLR